MRKQVLLGWSGGKDSALALQALRADPDIQVAGLLTSVTRYYDRMSVHGVRRALLERQAERLRRPLFTASSIPSRRTTHTKGHSFLPSNTCVASYRMSME